MEEYMMPCFIKATLGVECMGCGTQRALLMVGNGEIVQAYHFYPPVFTLIILGLAFILFLFKKNTLTKKLIIFSAIIHVFLLVFNYFYKFNII